MLSEKLASIMNDGRLIAASENIIYPMIQKMIDLQIDLAYGKFKKGESSFVTEIAYIAALKDLEFDLRSKQQKANKAMAETINT